MTSDTFIGHLDVWQLLKHPLFKLHSGKIKTASRKEQVFLPMSWFCFQILQFPSFVVVVVVINTTFTHFKTKETKTHPLLLLPDEWQDTQSGFKHLVFVSQQTRGRYNEIIFSKKLKAQSFATNWSFIKGKRKKRERQRNTKHFSFYPQRRETKNASSCRMNANSCVRSSIWCRNPWRTLKGTAERIYTLTCS